MGADLNIYSIRESKNIDETILTRITTIYNWEVIEKLLDIGRKNWCLEGECGAIFELTGEELNSIKDTLEFEDNRLINVEFDNEDWYRCSLSF